MKKILYLCSVLFLTAACSSDESGDSIVGNTNTLLREATISNDSEGTRYYSYDSNYNLTQIKNNVKTINFTYNPADEFNHATLKSITWKSGAITKKLELTYDEDPLLDIASLSLTLDGEIIVAAGSQFEGDWNYLKLDFGNYYELILRSSSGIKEIKKYNENGDFLENQSYRFSYYEPGTHGVDYGYGRNSDRTWMLRYLDQDEFFKIPLTFYAVNYIETFAQDNSYFRQHSHQFNGGILLNSKIHQEEEVFHNIAYKFDILPGKDE
jgi:hypothetical protein